VSGFEATYNLASRRQTDGNQGPTEPATAIDRHGHARVVEAAMIGIIPPKYPAKSVIWFRNGVKTATGPPKFIGLRCQWLGFV
jgi:hypothetical protein